MAPLLIEKDGVKVHIQSREHLPPHVHVFSGDDEALVNIRTGEVFEGYISSKKLRVVQDWLNENENRKLIEEIFYELNERLRPQKEKNTAKVAKKKGRNNGKQKS